MKIALIGYGKMGRIVETVATRRGHEVKERFMDVKPFSSDSKTKALLKDVSVLIDFSVPEAVLENIQAACDLSKHIVVGTTGWYNNLEDAKKIVEKSNIGMVYASNFSLGINLFYRIVERASELFKKFENYDPFIEEAHHKFKKDAPSGTALVLKKIVAGQYGEKDIPVTSVRAGYIPGKHKVSFDSLVDTISLEHTARNREGFAEGAILAAEWIENRKGFFEFQEVLKNFE